MSLELIKSIERNATYTEKAFNELKRLIMLNKLTVGTVLNERSLSEQLNTSRTPVNSALQILESKGWVVKSGKNKIVSPLILEDLQEKVQIRLALEILAIDLAKDIFNDAHLEHMKDLIDSMEECHTELNDNVAFLLVDKKLHLFLSEVSGNKNLHELLDNLLEHMLRSSIITFKKGSDRREYLIAEHYKMYECLQKRDFEALKTVTSKHLGEYIQKLKENL